MEEIKQHSSNSEGGDLKVISIQNQNPCLMKNWKEYEWLVTAPERNDPYYKKGSWTWLFNRLCMSIKPASGTENYDAVDPSNAGSTRQFLSFHFKIFRKLNLKTCCLTMP